MIHALILAGGSGTRFWPASRRQRPKQLLALEGADSLLATTAARLDPLIPASGVWVCTTVALADAVAADLPAVPKEQVLGEPEGRNTAPAIGWAVQSMQSRIGADDIVVVLPADHRVRDAAAFREALERAAKVASERDCIMTLGVTPTRPETGYGYIELGEAFEPATASAVARFTEKPDRATAEQFVSSGRYLWNAGIFVFRAATMLRKLAEFEPTIADGLARIAAKPDRLAELYSELPSISIDYAVMERDRELGAVALDCGWSDLGSWEAVDEIVPLAEDGNRIVGEAFTVDSNDNLLFADNGVITTIGVSDLVVVRTADAVLVMPKSRAQDVKQLVDRLKADSRTDLL